MRGAVAAAAALLRGASAQTACAPCDRSGPCVEPGSGFCNRGTGTCQYTMRAAGQACLISRPPFNDLNGVCDAVGQCNDGAAAPPRPPPAAPAPPAALPPSWFAPPVPPAPAPAPPRDAPAPPSVPCAAARLQVHEDCCIGARYREGGACNGGWGTCRADGSCQQHQPPAPAPGPPGRGRAQPGPSPVQFPPVRYPPVQPAPPITTPVPAPPAFIPRPRTPARYTVSPPASARSPPVGAPRITPPPLGTPAPAPKGQSTSGCLDSWCRPPVTPRPLTRTTPLPWWLHRTLTPLPTPAPPAAPYLASLNGEWFTFMTGGDPAEPTEHFRLEHSHHMAVYTNGDAVHVFAVDGNDIWSDSLRMSGSVQRGGDIVWSNGYTSRRMLYAPPATPPPPAGDGDGDGGGATGPRTPLPTPRVGAAGAAAPGGDEDDDDGSSYIAIIAALAALALFVLCGALFAARGRRAQQQPRSELTDPLSPPLQLQALRPPPAGDPPPRRAEPQTPLPTSTWTDTVGYTNTGAAASAPAAGRARPPDRQPDGEYRWAEDGTQPVSAPGMHPGGWRRVSPPRNRTPPALAPPTPPEAGGGWGRGTPPNAGIWQQGY